MFIGFALGALSIFGPVKLGTALLLLIVPIVDVAWAIVRRLLSGHSIASSDKYHIYHRMLELGLSRRAVVLLFYGLCIVLGMIDLRLTKVYKLEACAVVALLVAASAVALEVRGRHAACATLSASHGRLPTVDQ
jgi:UDP-GlcNAc:undecaprenyl-phosphate GlcNAc-1-phosphate transferase